MSKLWQSEQPIFFTPPPTKWDKRMHKDAPDYPQPDPRMYDIMQQQTNLSADALKFVKDSFAQNQVRQQALDAMQLKIGDSLLKDADTNRQRGQEAYDFYMKEGRPLQEQVIDEAKNYDSEGNLSAFRGRAAADVAQTYGNAEQQQARTLSRFGVMPNANRLATINSNLAISKAAAQAGAMTNAEMGVRDRAVGMRAGAANMVAGMPNTAMQWGAAGQGAGQAAFGNATAANGQNMQSQQLAQSGFSGAGNMLSQAGSLGANLYGTQMQGWGTAQQIAQNESAGFGSLVGMGAMAMGYADGGKVSGPGTGVSDSVPAINESTGGQVRLSNGEYVIPADVVRAKGEEFFNKLLEKHHTPAAIQRKRRG